MTIAPGSKRLLRQKQKSSASLNNRAWKLGKRRSLVAVKLRTYQHPQYRRGGTQGASVPGGAETVDALERVKKSCANPNLTVVEMFKEKGCTNALFQKL